MTQTSLAAPAVEELRAAVSGVVLRRGEDGFAEEITGYNLAGPVDPDVVVGAADESDVVAAVRFARTQDLPVYVQSTGHGAYAPISRGVLVRTHRLTAIDIDPDSRLATLGAGVRWGDLLGPAGEHGLTAITGSSPGVGAVGLVLGGGLGPLSRTYGFAADYAREFRLVTAEGEVVTASETERPDLFWALRGGKGGFGVVTRMTIELVPQPSVYGGGLFFAAEDAAAALHAWVDWTGTVPETVTSSTCLVRFPPLPTVPEPLRGRTILHLRFTYTGEPGMTAEQRRAAGEELLRPLRELGTPVLDTIDDLPTSAIGTVHSDPPDPMDVWEQGALLDQIDHEFADVVLRHVGPETDVPLSAVEVRHLGGAAGEDRGGAVGGRSARYSLVLIGVPDAALFTEVLPTLGRAVAEDVQPWVCSETNYNFAGHPSTPEAFARNWPPAVAERLGEIRRTYDPAGVFPIGPTAR